MTWTYSGDPSSSNKDAVRFYIGDTDSTTPHVTDEEIAFALSQQGNNPRRAAASLARSLSAKYAHKVDKSIGDLSISYSQSASQYMALANLLDSEAASGSGAAVVPYLGGMTISDKRNYELDAGLVKPAFRREQFGNKG